MSVFACAGLLSKHEIGLPLGHLMQAGGWQGISQPLVFDFPPDLNLPYESREALLSKASSVGVVGVRLNVPQKSYHVQ